VRVDAVSASVQKRTFGVSVCDVTAIDAWIEDVTTRLGVSEKTAFRTRVCVAELASNVLEHGFQPNAGDHITISIASANDGVQVEFADTRGAFDPTIKPSTTRFDDLQNGGGRGLVLLHAYAANMDYANDGTYNRLKFHVNFSG